MSDTSVWDVVRWLLPIAVTVLLFLVTALTKSLGNMREQIEHLHRCLEDKIKLVEDAKVIEHQRIQLAVSTQAERVAKLEVTAGRLDRVEGKVDSLSDQIDVKLDRLFNRLVSADSRRG